MVRMMGEALAPAARQGQSVDAVIAGNPELFGGYSRSTVYGWIGDAGPAKPAFLRPFIASPPSHAAPCAAVSALASRQPCVA